MKKFRSLTLTKENGQTMVDLVIALALLAMAISSAGALATATTRASNEAGRRSQATALATRELEALKNYRDSKARLDERWVGIPDGGGVNDCATLVMRRGVTDQGKDTGWQIISAGTHVPYSDLDDADYSKFNHFKRLVTVCDGRDFDPVSGYRNSNDIKTVQVEVVWEEGDQVERKLTFNSVLVNWETR